MCPRKLQIIVLMSVFFSTSVYSVVYHISIPIDHGTCENWTLAVKANTGECTRNGRVLHCFGGMSNVQTLNPQKMKKIEEVILCGWPNITFDPHLVLKYFPKVRVLRLDHSNLTHIHNDFPDLYHLESINISWTNLAYTRPTLFKRVHNLKFLDLRWNQLNHMEGPLILSKTIENLYLAGNPWNCTRNIKWILNPEKGNNIADKDILYCADSKYYGKDLLTVMHYKTIIKQECFSHPETRNCSCSIHYIRRSEDGKFLVPIYAVNCSSLSLHSFPSYLPDNTTILYITDNQITDMRPLRNNLVYRNVIDVYLDFNQIQSIDVLEAGFWLRHFRVLSLKGNKLTRLPIYALDNALENNHQAARLQLSLNPWICDCKFTMRFRELLMKYHTIIRDSHNITCKYIEGDDNFMAQVLSLNRADVCKLPPEYKIQPLDLLNGILAFLIVLVLGKLAYDYYYYKSSGRIPWIVSKIL